MNNPTTTHETTASADSYTVGLSTTEGETVVTVDADMLDLDEAEAFIADLKYALAKARELSA